MAWLPMRTPEFASGKASPACAVCTGALNLLSQVGATVPALIRPGARLPTLSLLAQDC